MSLMLKGTFVKALPIAQGVSKMGNPWVRGGFVMEYGEDYPRQVAFSVNGEDRANNLTKIQPGTPIEVRFAPESREYEGKYFTDLKCFGIMLLTQAPQGYISQQPPAQAYTQAQPAAPAFAPVAPAQPMMPAKDPDLPF